jgi:hypothetical protein
VGQARLHSNLNAFSKGTPQPTSPKEGAIIFDRLRTPSWIQSATRTHPMTSKTIP